MKYEFIKYIKSKKFLMVFILLMILSIVQCADTFYYTKIISFYGEANAAFMSILSNNNNVKYTLILNWIMPIYLILAYCDKYNIERKCGIKNLYLTKMSRKKHFLVKMGISFINPFILVGIPVIINLLINITFLHGNNGFFHFEMYSRDELEIYEYFPMEHPYISFFLSFLAFLVVCGILGCVCQSICILARDNKISYVLCLVFWMLYFTEPDFSIAAVIQPFTFEYPLYLSILDAALFCAPAIAIIIITYIVSMGRKDEI